MAESADIANIILGFICRLIERGKLHPTIWSASNSSVLIEIMEQLHKEGVVVDSASLLGGLARLDCTEKEKGIIFREMISKGYAEL